MGGEVEDARKENQFLESELKLAKKDNIYFVIDLKEKKIHLKAKGEAFKEFPIEQFNVWGKGLAPVNYALFERSSFFKPKREKLSPVKKEEQEEKVEEEGEDAEEDIKPAGTFELDALELKDMPGGYKLIFDGGVVVSVRSSSRNKALSILKDAGFYIKWYLLRPVQTVWYAATKKPFYALHVKLSAEDARALYWSSPEKTEYIFLLP